MGAYLSQPVTDKQTESANGGTIHYGATSMQGWRINQEDAHNCILNFDGNGALFAVYDGHGGSEVSQYSSMKFPDFLKEMPAWKEGRFGQALEDAFLKFDEFLTREDVMEELRVLAGTKKKEGEPDEPEEDKALLYEEACLPLEEVLRKYGIQVITGGGERRLLSPKKVKRDKKAPKTAAAATEEGPPTPPSSPDARSAAVAATGENTATSRCDSSVTATDQENSETLPMSPPGDNEHLVNSSTQSKRARFALKRKSNMPLPDDDLESSSNSKLSQGDNGENKNLQLNGTNDADGKMHSASPDELPNVKRFKNQGNGEKMVADSTTGLDESNESIPSVNEGSGERKSVNGSHATAGGIADSTSNDNLSKSKPILNKTLNEAANVNDVTGGNAGSPMIIEENKVNEEKPGNNQLTNETRNHTMDESSGASEDDEDEDYNMEVEDEETTGEEEEEEETSESGGIEEDEIADEQDEMEEEEEDEDEEEELEDDDMFAMPAGDSPGVDSGTTACIAVIKNSTIYVANAGDSRCVLCRGDLAVDLSLDHKPEDTTEKTRIELAGGKITADGRVNGGLNLSRAIGDHFYKRNSGLPLRDQMITALPDVRVEPMKPEDRFLVLACDGIWNSMNSQEVVDFVRVRLAKGLMPDQICEELCDYCLAPNTVGDGTGCDNMTAIVVLLNQSSISDGSDHAASSIVDSSQDDSYVTAVESQKSEAEAKSL